ncbi:MAG: isopenicillin N synthase family dioxygenase [Caulobacteraceae bacterium]
MIDKVAELSLKAFTQGSPAERAAFSRAFMAGLQRHGFIILKDHGVDAALLKRAYALAQQVFALPDETKRRYASGMRGYTPFGTEHAKYTKVADLKEFWQIGHEPANDGSDPQPFAPNVWPAETPEFQPTFQALFDRLNETGVVLLHALAPELGLPEGHFDPLVRRGTSILRVLHYPPLQPGMDPNAVRSAQHEDINFLTIMVAAEGAGLELLDRDGSWLPVETEPSNLIVDSGDMLARMTGGLIPATTHRVVNPAGPNVSRYSMPFFMHPTLKTSLEVLPSCAGRGLSQPPITAGEYLQERLKAIGMAK